MTKARLVILLAVLLAVLAGCNRPAEDIGQRLSRECVSITAQVERLEGERKKPDWDEDKRMRFVQACIISRGMGEARER